MRSWRNVVRSPIAFMFFFHSSSPSRPRESGVDHVSCHVDHGEPAHVLVDAAKKQEADLLVVGSKGMTKATRFLLGSVPNTVSHKMPCDVLIVHTAP